ncbi:MAG: hypothetical protein RMI01_08845 [Thermodesulfovibrio sp.]|nr:hypothetical protein [Thermodesulfovibrio sp.]
MESLRDIDYIVEIKETALRSRQERVRYYNSLKKLVLDNDRDNPLYAHLEVVTSLCYYPDNIIFDINLDNEAKLSDVEFEAVKRLVRRMGEDYVRDGLDIKFYDWIMWGLLYGNYFVKVFIDGSKVKVKPVAPHFISVLNEEHEELDEHQAVVHTVYLPKVFAKKKYGSKVDFYVGGNGRDGESLDRKFISKVDEQNALVVEGIGEIGGIKPKRYEDVIEVNELWYWDWELNDYVMVQFIGDVIVEQATASQCFIRGKLPFVNFKPRAIEGSFWGMSELHYLITLYDKLGWYYDKLEHLIDLLISPPMVISGLSGTVESEEIKKKLNTPNSVIEIIDPTSKIDLYAPKITPDIMAGIVNKYEDNFKARSGLQGILRGSPMPNVRSANYAQILAQFASAPLKKLALKSECFIEDVMTLYITAIALTDAKYKELAGVKMMADIFAHTSSPITAMAYEDRILTLADFGVIPMEVVVDLLPLPKKDEIISKIKDWELKQQLLAEYKAKGGKQHGR